MEKGRIVSAMCNLNISMSRVERSHNQCNMTFSNNNSLRAHVKNFHENGKELNKMPFSEKPVKISLYSVDDSMNDENFV